MSVFAFYMGTGKGIVSEVVGRGIVSADRTEISDYEGRVGNSVCGVRVGIIVYRGGTGTVICGCRMVFFPFHCVFEAARVAGG